MLLGHVKSRYGTVLTAADKKQHRLHVDKLPSLQQWRWCTQAPTWSLFSLLPSTEEFLVYYSHALFLSVFLSVCLGYMTFVFLEVTFRQSARHLV